MRLALQASEWWGKTRGAISEARFNSPRAREPIHTLSMNETVSLCCQ